MQQYYEISFVERAAYHQAIKAMFYGLTVDDEVYSEIVLGEMIVNNLVKDSEIVSLWLDDIKEFLSTSDLDEWKDIAFQRYVDEHNLVLDNVDGHPVYVGI